MPIAHLDHKSRFCPGSVYAVNVIKLANFYIDYTYIGGTFCA